MNLELKHDLKAGFLFVSDVLCDNIRPRISEMSWMTSIIMKFTARCINMKFD